MPTQSKGNTLRLYLNDADLKALRDLTEALEIPQTEVMSRIMAAGIRALVEGGYRMPLPLKFSLADEGCWRMNEKPEPKTHGRK